MSTPTTKGNTVAHLGNFGKPIGPIDVPAEKLDTIGIGVPVVQIRLNPADKCPSFPMMEFARLLAMGLPDKDQSTMSTTYGVIGACVYSEDFGKFRTVATQIGDEGLVDLVFALYERWSEVPLGGSSTSSDGATTTPEQPSEPSPRRSRRAKRQGKSETPEEVQARMEAVILGTSSAQSPQDSSTP